MKSLSLSKPLVLVMVGVPGAGKSFFARQFSETFGAPVVSYDRLQQLLFGGNSRGKDEQKKVAELAAYQVEELLKTLKTFIVDGAGASKAERTGLRKLARTHGYEMLLVWVQTDATTAQYRSMKRSARKLDDQYNASLTTEEYTQATRRFNPPLTNEDIVVISGKHTYATQARVVLKKLVAAREAMVDTRTIVNHENRPLSSRPDQPDQNPGRRNVLIR